MSLAEAYAKGATPTRKAAKAARILILDIERIPGHATLQHRGLTITGPFWDLNGWKHTIGRRIPPDTVTEWPRTICAAARWYDQRTHLFAAEWEEGGNDQFLRTVWDWYDAADMVVGHNIRGFDTKHLKAAWALLGLPTPAPWRTIDTLTIARREFGFESNTLDSLCQRLGIDAKTDKYDVPTARAACAGDVKAQKKLRAYNIGDIGATTALYDRLRPWIKTHPHLGLWTGDDRACPNCGGDKFVEQADVHTDQTRYAARRCANCGAIVRNSFMKQRVTTRAAL